MGLGTTQVAPALDSALKPFPLRDPDDPNLLSHLEERNGQHLADAEL